MGLRTQGRFVSGLADELSGLLRKVGESAAPLEQFVQEPAAAAAEYEGARARLCEALADLGSALAKAGKPAPPPLGRAVLECPPGQLAQAWAVLRLSSPGHLTARGADKEVIAKARAAWDALLDADAGVRGAALAADLVLLARHAATRHRELKARACALDFDDLTRLCRDLLVRDAPACAAERERVGALLVDEFQDTSRAQIELLERLGGERAVAVVGDRKQSIYEFRGADVAGAQAFAGRLLQRGADRFVLAESRRSRPALVEFGNLLFSRALAGPGRPFDTPFAADDALTAFRPPGPGGACAELLDVAGTGVDVEAEQLARRIAALLAPGAPERVFDRDENPRPVRGGDIAVLLRKTTNLEAFRRALLRRRIPHLVYKGRGFHGAREVMDLVALLAAAADPDDTLALASVLRSPVRAGLRRSAGPAGAAALVAGSSARARARRRRGARPGCDAPARAAARGGSAGPVRAPRGRALRHGLPGRLRGRPLRRTGGGQRGEAPRPRSRSGASRLGRAPVHGKAPPARRRGDARGGGHGGGGARPARGAPFDGARRQGPGVPGGDRARVRCARVQERRGARAARP